MPFFKSRQAQESERNFVLGAQSLRAYLAGGNVRFLEDAEANLDSISRTDRRYDVARFYLGITKTQLRKTDESIPIFLELKERKRGKANAEIAHKIDLQLAYAHIKTYREEGYQAAEDQLRELETAAALHSDPSLLAQSQAIHVFLYSVLAGRSEQEERRPDFAREALALGEQLLKSASLSPGIKFEALNAMGITYMRVAEADWAEFGERSANWERAQAHYDDALRIIPNSVRVLQNLAKLRLLQVADPEQGEATTLLEDAKDFCLRSLAVNDQDQYPYLELAKIAAAEGDPKSAMKAVMTGRTRPGVVDEAEWKRVEGVAQDFTAMVAETGLSPETFKPDAVFARRIVLFLEGKSASWKE